MIKLPDGDYEFVIGRHKGKRLSWVVEHRSNWLVEYAITAFPEYTEIFDKVLKERERQWNNY